MNEPTRLEIPASILNSERWLRDHPGTVAVLSILSIALIGFLRPQARGDLSRALTLAVPLGICSYSIGLIPGMVMAIGVTFVWLLDTLNLGLKVQDAPLMFGARMVSNVGVVVMASIASAAARERERYVEAQKQMMNMQADLVSAFSHDLRTPLTAITAYAAMLEDGGDGGIDVADASGRILINAERLNHLIADMLTASRPDSVASVVLGEVEPESLLRDLRVEFDHVGEEQQIDLQWHIADGMPPLCTDSAKLTSIVRNLVNNAVKYTRGGRVTVRILYASENEHYRIEVEDTGPGIAPEAIPHLFDPFYRVKSTSSTSGFGLGLFIVKRFVELLHGTIRVESVVDQGTCFFVTVPSLAKPSSR